MQIKKHLLDKRVIKRALQEGLVDKALYQRTLDELPDLSHRIQSAAVAAPVPVMSEELDIPEDDEDEDEDEEVDGDEQPTNDTPDSSQSTF